MLSMLAQMMVKTTSINIKIIVLIRISIVTFRRHFIQSGEGN